MISKKLDYVEDYLKKNTNDYALNLVEEYKKATGIKNNHDLVMKEFLEWYKNRLVSLIGYSKFIECILTSGNAIEINHGYFDTTIDYMNKENVAALTSYKNTYPLNLKKWIINGYLLNDFNNTKMIIDNKQISTKNIDTFFIQLSDVSKPELSKVIKATGNDSDIIIGTYGNIYDKNKEQNINQIIQLYVDFLDANLNTKKYSTNLNENYISFVKVYKRDKNK